MFGSGEVIGSRVAQETHLMFDKTLRALSQMVGEAASARGLSPGLNPFVRPCDFVVAIDNTAVYLVLDEERVSNTPTHTYLDLRASPAALSIEAIQDYAWREKGMRKTVSVVLPAAAASDDDATRRQALTPLVREICDMLEERELLANLTIPEGYEHLRRFMPAFLADHAEVDRNVFLMMRFKTGKQFQEIERVIRETLAASGYHVMRADDKAYASELWDNVLIYMLGCPLGITVFEEIDEREFNPNVALELGFMLALDRRCLVLKDQRMPRMPTDIIGRLYKTFDTYDIAGSLTRALESWLKDIA